MSAAKIEEGMVKGRSGGHPSLYFRARLPDAPKAVLGLLHGYADHATRYDHVVTELFDAGIGVVALDMRGHGKSEGERGYCDRFGEFLADSAELTKLVDERAKGASTFLFGHSFGGLVAALTMLDAPGVYKGLLLSGPFFGLALAVPAVKVFAGKIASRVLPTLGLPSGLHGADLTHDTAHAKAYDDDPLVFKKAKARWFTEATKAQEDVLARANKLSVPLYEMFGMSDKVASPKVGKQFFDAAGHEDKTWVPKEGLFHEILNEPSYRETCAGMAKWMIERAERRTG
jgi:alpha-beta hydrolase superfamily lysophospholipase